MNSRRTFDVETAPDILMMTFDALRFDVAERAYRENRTPYLAGLLPTGWECRHSPGNFTFSAHAALFAGFWPTPSAPAPHSRPFALRFPGSRTVDAATMMLEGDNIVDGLQRLGFRTVCVGGVGFFNKMTPLGSVFPSMFEESYWQPEFAVSEAHSTRAQVGLAVDCVSRQSAAQPMFLFVNISATHPPTFGYLKGADRDSIESQMAALAYVDRQLPPLCETFRRRGRSVKAYLMSDHGTLFGEDGYSGHRVGHAAVWTVPYGEFEWGPPA
jgi:hypothetical protein